MSKLIAIFAVLLAILAMVFAYALHLRQQTQLRQALRDRETQLKGRYLGAIRDIIADLEGQPPSTSSQDVEHELNRLKALVSEQASAEANAARMIRPESSAAPMLRATPISSDGSSEDVFEAIERRLSERRGAFAGRAPAVDSQESGQFKSDDALLQEPGRIAFVADRNGNSEIFTVNSDGDQRRQLTFTDSDELFPAWSPDGSQIAYVSNVDGEANLFIMDVKTGDETQLTASAESEFWPAWSPDGKQIAYGADGDGGDIYVLNVDDESEPLHLTEGMFPCWSPDGKTVLFQRGAGAFQIDADGSNEREMIPEAKELRFAVLMPRYSPDGSQILFSSVNIGDPDSRTSDFELDVFVYETASKAPKRVTHSPEREFALDWSADGKQIIYYTLNNQRGRIKIMNADGSNQRFVTTVDTRSPWASWRRVTKSNADTLTSDTRRKSR